MSLHNTFATDKKKEVEGQWVRYGQNDDGTTIEMLIARAGGRNIQFERVAEFVYKPARRRINMGDIDPVELRILTQTVFARSVVKDWRGVRNEDGEEIPFGEQTFLALMEEFPDIWLDVKDFAESMGNYRVAQVEADAKN